MRMSYEKCASKHAAFVRSFAEAFKYFGRPMQRDSAIKLITITDFYRSYTSIKSILLSIIKNIWQMITINFQLKHFHSSSGSKYFLTCWCCCMFLYHCLPWRESSQTAGCSKWLPKTTYLKIVLWILIQDFSSNLTCSSADKVIIYNFGSNKFWSSDKALDLKVFGVNSWKVFGLIKQWSNKFN